MTPLRAIRAKCLDCCGGFAADVQMCPCSDCPLYPFRRGKNPNLQRERTPAQLEALKRAVFHFRTWTNSTIWSTRPLGRVNYTPDTQKAAEAK